MELNQFVNELFDKAKEVGFDECEVYMLIKKVLV